LERQSKLAILERGSSLASQLAFSVESAALSWVGLVVLQQPVALRQLAFLAVAQQGSRALSQTCHQDSLRRQTLQQWMHSRLRGGLALARALHSAMWRVRD
jgi:hypothetical protein